MNLNNFFEKSLNEVKIFCDYVLFTNNFYERELLLYKFCPFQDISYDELIKTIELFEVKTIYEFIIILIYGLNYSDEELLIINDVLTKYNFKENINTFLKKGLHVQKRFQNSLNNNDIGITSEIMAYNYEKERLINEGRFDLGNNIIWASRYIGDIFGYDILSHTLNGEEKLIEVKGTENELDSFKLSHFEELNFNKENTIFYIYHVDLKNNIIYEITKKDNVIIDGFGNIYEKENNIYVRKK